MANFFKTIISFILRAVVLAAGLVFAFGLFVTGLVLTVGLVGLSVVRGRRLQHAQPAQPMRATRGDVVDIEAREIRDGR